MRCIRLSCFYYLSNSLSWPWHFWGVLVSYFVECPSTWVCSMLSHSWSEVMHFLARILIKMTCIIMSKVLWCWYVLILVILTLITQLTLCLPCFSTMNEIVKDRLFGVWLFVCVCVNTISRFWDSTIFWQVLFIPLHCCEVFHSVNVTAFPLPLGEVGNVSISLSIACSTTGVGPLSTVYSAWPAQLDMASCDSRTTRITI